jgi:hypothetical protein
LRPALAVVVVVVVDAVYVAAAGSTGASLMVASLERPLALDSMALIVRWLGFVKLLPKMASWMAVG